MPALGLVREVAVTGIETFREKQQAANTITVFPEVVWMFKFIFVPLGVIGPDMLDFVTVLALALNVLRVPAGQPGMRFHVVRHSS